MDKRALLNLFSDRLQHLLSTGTQSTAQFLSETGIDRSALSQFLDPNHVRLPRSETLRNIAAARGFTIDWLLGLENVPEGRQSLSTSFQMENADDGGHFALEKLREEIQGQKLRYITSLLPDMLNLALQDNAAVGESEIRGLASENMLSGKMPDNMDIEICMPIQTLQSLANQSGYWKDSSPVLCQRQLEHMAEVCNATYPTLRLHVYDGNRNYSSSFTVFGKKRVAVYLGDAYLVLTRQDEIQSFVKRFDLLVREAVVSADKTGELLKRLAGDI